LLLEVLAGRVAVEDLFALGIEVRLRLGVERFVRAFFAERPPTRADAAVVLFAVAVRWGAQLAPFTGALSAGVFRILQPAQLFAQVLQRVLVEAHLLETVGRRLERL